MSRRPGKSKPTARPPNKPEPSAQPLSPAPEPLSPAPEETVETSTGEAANLSAEATELTDAGEAGLVHRRWEIKRQLNTRRLDKYLADRVTHLSRTAIAKMIKDGVVTVNGRPSKPSHEPLPGDVIEMSVPPPLELDMTPEDMPLDVLYEDEHMVVINKAAGVMVHPSRGVWTGTLVNGLLAHVQKLSNYHEDRLRPGVVHRLDKNTTGLIVFAKTEEAHWRLAVQWENRQVRKEYLALVEGVPTVRSDWIDQPIGKHPTHREKYAVRPDAGKPSLTYYEAAERFEGFTLLRVEIHTGRTHQIRVHLLHEGLPIVADDMYGRREQLWLSDIERAVRQRLGGARSAGSGSSASDGLVRDEVLISRQALHAWRLRITHPLRNVPMELEAPLPTDLTRTLTALRARALPRGKC